jgi:hypothetical protein
MIITEPRGHQTANISHIQPGVTDDSILTLAEICNIELLPWQQDVLKNLVARKPDDLNRWAAREALLLVPRQNGKSLVLMIRMIMGALVLNDKTIMYSAHDYRTSLDFWLMMLETLESSPMLKKRIKKTRNSAAERKIIFDNGNTITMISRTANAGRGLHPDLVVFDEAFSVGAEIVASVMPSQAARPNPQTIWASSAGSILSVELLAIRKRLHGRSDPYLTGWDWFAEIDHETSDPKTHAEANPSLGFFLRHEELARQCLTMRPQDFRREHLGQWADVIIDRVFDPEDLQDIITEARSAPSDHIACALAFGVEITQLGVHRESATVSAVWRESDLGPTFVTVIRKDVGVEWLPEFMHDLALKYPGSPFAYDAKSPGRDLYERAEAMGDMTTKMINFGEWTKACASFAQQAKEKLIMVCTPPTSLTLDMTNAQQRTVGASWVWDRAVRFPPSSLIAATAALWAHDHEEIGVPQIW